ncbi:DNA polymerase zeta catalytic subunit isoform X2 [Herrania umbratica]|uniref:DNA polymerase zeta catalytic subunit n=1 Tax=Herrania umbratica TaxID=108875 RepID=A0A6J1A3D2_9ROSI|nr:DNA polymerase zeta catalytic subunit isoform X2 [Herrania umbratica]
MSDSQPDSNVFSVRIVSIDHYMAPPISGYDICYSSFQGERVNEVPVIRIYGSSPAGQKTCLHIHRALPYLYVPLADILPQGSHTHQEDHACADALALALEKALKLKGGAGSKRQRVHGCSLVRAKKFYGYHSSEELFVKIYLYYPHDVSRAANLLLAGAVLDKSLQPHESHIPFILQFLVDYNLYGMGHLHLSRMKFRNPIPDLFHPRKMNNCGQHGQKMDEFTLKAAGFQADSSYDACISSPVWISSTIPGEWMWHVSTELDVSSDLDICHVKRQSLCELEGDATLDDILNQQFKLYTSLSQTCSDLKMVQSLIPIWEEEHERTGMHEMALPSYPDRPLSEDVLKALSLGLGFENELMKLCSKVEETLSCNELGFEQSVMPSANEENLVGPTHINLNHTVPQALSCLKEKNLLGSLLQHCKPCEKEMNAASSEKKDVCPELWSVGEILSSQTVITSDPKATDTEALGLLKWLANSHAADDINSDDELVRETILTPLLPATTIDKVLEKASIDYESESQKECQDILDSVRDLIDFEGLKERNSHSCDHIQISSGKHIPQTDGSSDELGISPSAGSVANSSKADMKTELKRSSQDTGKTFSTKRKRKKLLWGSLPLSVTGKGKDNSDSVSFNITEGCADEIKECLGTSFSAENDLGKASDPLNENAHASDCDKPEAGTLVECSVRDLMRRKRSHRIELADCGSVRSENIHLKTEKGTDSFFCPKQLNFHGLHDELDKKDPGSLNHSPSLANEQKEFPEAVGLKPTHSDSVYCTLPQLSGISNPAQANTGHREQMGKKLVLNFYPKKHDSAISIGHCETFKGKEFDFRVTSAESRNTDAHTSKAHKEIDSPDERLQQTDTNGSWCLSASPHKHKVLGMDGYIHETYYEGEISLSADKPVGIDAMTDKSYLQKEDCGGGKQGCITGLVVDVEAKPVELIGMTFCKKPPTADWNDGATENVTHLPTTQHSPSLFNEENCQGTSGRALDEVLPFFSRGCEEEKEIQNKFLGNNNSNFHQEAALGVPIHYQNNGSFLYLLTPVSSPPSPESVYRWLSCDEGSHRQSNAVSSESPSLAGSTECLIASENSSPVNCNEALTESSSKYHMTSMLEQGHPEKNMVLGSEVKSCSNESRTPCRSEENIRTVNACADGSQDMSQISGPDGKSRPTPLSQIGFRDPASVGAGQQLTLLSLEVHTESRGDLLPDPRFDAVNVVALAIQNDNDSVTEVHVLLYSKTGFYQRNLDGISGFNVFVFSEEKNLFGQFMKILCSLDPDILMGWDVQGGSLGFLAERAAYLGIGLLNKVSRAPSETKIKAKETNISQNGSQEELLSKPLIADSIVMEDAIIEDEWGRTHASGVHVGGRIVLNVWRLMRGEVKLNMYTVEAVAESVLRQKIPSIPYKVLTKWFSSGPARARYRCVEYVVERAKLNLQIMNKLDMINRTSELARVFGIDFFSVLSRGSQFRVESMFLRLAHTQNYLAISPGNQQVASQPAMECLPLVMEPESGFYADPVVVLDFQSLYPSMIIAYNLCFCTCLGKIANSKVNTLGVSSYAPNPNVLQNLKGQVLLTPNGVMYVPSKVRKGVLPRLLEEILSTRIMVKQAMKKLTPSQQVLQRIFNARQIALKLIANVTYGYTAAGFSGRMPCAELADSIVQCGRSTLEKAISYVNAHEKWRANVIYGDTDSMFVLLKGRTVKESFKIGHEIASAITAMNPNPVTLKMEKVYHPCFLLTKKRYVGYSYESPDQVKPVFDAKGIETVRRDTCGAVAKTMEQSLRLFFEHQDIPKVKAYLHRQWTRILSGRVSLQDFVFAKEVRLGTYSTKVGSLPPAAIVATKAMRADPRAEPRYAERVPYVVIHGEPGARLVDMVVDPLELLAINSPYRLNDLYYINKQIIPALQRVFGLVGADLNRWFSEMPRLAREAFGKCSVHALNPQRTRIDYYYLSKHCILCGDLVYASAHLCGKCSENETAAATAIVGRTSKSEREMQHLVAICRHCGGGDWLVESGVKCNSLACSVFYERRKVQKELQGLSAVATDKGLYPKCMVEWF